MLRKISESFRKKPTLSESTLYDISLSIDGHAEKSEQPLFYINEIVTGFVELEVKIPSIQVLAINVHLIGREILNNNTEDQFMFLNMIERSISTFHELESGDYAYPFTFMIPQWCPSSTTMEHGEIKYELILSFKFSTSDHEEKCHSDERKMSVKSIAHSCETTISCLECCGKIYKIIPLHIRKFADIQSVDYPDALFTERKNLKFFLSNGQLDYTLTCPRVLVKNEDHRINLAFQNSSLKSLRAVSLCLQQTVSVREMHSNECTSETFLIKKQKFKIDSKRNDNKKLALQWRVPDMMSNSVFYGSLSDDDLSVQKADERYPCQSHFAHLNQTPNLNHALCSDGGGVLLSVSYQLVIKLKLRLAKNIVETLDVFMYDNHSAKSTAILPAKRRQVSPAPFKANETHQQLGFISRSTELI
jgi:hypothetical protein